MTSLRSRIAASVPAVLRKAVRMTEHYVRRHVEWVRVLGEMRGATPADQRLLWRSAFCAPVTALASLDGFQPPRLLGDVDVAVKGVGCFRLRAGTDDIIHVLSAREPVERRLVETLLRPGDLFVDAGANIGFYSLLAHRLVGPEGRVVCFEMMPPTAARLRDHLALNGAGNVTLVEKALSDRQGDVIVATSSPDKFGQASIVADAADAARSVRHEVETATLDAALAGCGPVRLIKMDLEGAEFLALSGASDVLARTDAVIFETNGHDPRILALLRDAGFEVSAIAGPDYIARRTGV